ncbi:MAG: hypothetical protein NC230_04435 [Bacteroides sp.]|nr:hypothetical protein [Bacteroides sp.]
MEQAKELAEKGSNDKALTLLDSIDHVYPKAVETRSETRMLRPLWLEQYTARQLSVNDSLMTANQIEGEQLRSQLRYVTNAIEGYYVATGNESVDVRNSGGLHSRVSPDFHFYLTASSPGSVAMTAVALESDGESIVSEQVPYDGERNTRNSSCETITFTEAQSAPLAEFVNQHAKSPITIRFIGSNGRTHTMTLSDTQKNAMLTCYGLTMAANADKRYRLEKERLTRQLEIARNQIANVADR